MRAILTQQESGLAAIPVEIKILLSLVMFFAMGAFIIVSLPLIAAALGGGLGVSPGGLVMNTMTSMASAARRGWCPPESRKPDISISQIHFSRYFQPQISEKED